MAEQDVILLVYADLQVDVEISSPHNGYIGHLDETEKDILNQLIYLTLNSFNYIRTSYVVRMEILRNIERAKHNDKV